MTQRRDFSALVEHLERQQWPAVSLRGRVIGGSEVQWIRALPQLPLWQLRALERRLMRETSTRRNEMTTKSSLELEVCEFAEDLAQHGRLESVITGGQVYSTAMAIKAMARSATESVLQDALKQLHAMGDRADAADARQREWAAEDERRRTAHVQSDEEREQVEAENERARQIAEQEGSTESRLGRIEDVLIRIAGLLEKR
jgi:hypothetical protein